MGQKRSLVKEQDISREQVRQTVNQKVAKGMVEAIAIETADRSGSPSSASRLTPPDLAAVADGERGIYGTAEDPNYSKLANEAPSGIQFEHLRRVVDEFNAVLDKCAVDAEVEPVHHLRTGSRRVQALVETILRETGTAGRALEESARAWLRQVKKVRRAAGSVRDLDVHRKLIEKSLRKAQDKLPRHPASPERTEPLFIAADPPFDGDAGPSRSIEEEPFRAQALMLENWLKDKRQARAEIFKKQIKKQRQKLMDRQRAFFSALEQGQVRGVKTPRAAAAVALDAFVRVVDTFSSLDSANLHDFRKLTKKARYVAESGDEAQDARTVAKALKRVQDVIGDWHDWQCLTEESKAALEKDGLELKSWLERRAERSLNYALKTTEQMRGQLLGEWIATRRTRRGLPKKASIPRKPPASAHGSRHNLSMTS